MTRQTKHAHHMYCRMCVVDGKLQLRVQTCATTFLLDNMFQETTVSRLLFAIQSVKHVTVMMMTMVRIETYTYTTCSVNHSSLYSVNYCSKNLSVILSTISNSLLLKQLLHKTYIYTQNIID